MASSSRGRTAIRGSPRSAIRPEPGLEIPLTFVVFDALRVNG
jgi:hypothetical protein